MTASQHPFDRVIALHGGDVASLCGQTSADYWNSISPFGGTTAATMLQAMLQHPQRLGDSIALTINFAAAIQQGGFRMLRPVRTGRSTRHWLAELIQPHGPAPAITASAVFAQRRET